MLFHCYTDTCLMMLMNSGLLSVNNDCLLFNMMYSIVQLTIWIDVCVTYILFLYFECL